LSFALNSFVLTLSSTLILLYLIGLGWLLNYWLLKQRFSQVTIEELPLLISHIILSGIITNFTLVLLFQNLGTSIAIGIVIGIGGLIHLLATIRKNINLGKTIKNFQKPEWWLIGLVLIALYFLLITSTPIFEWDARSIWFLHGKMIYGSQTIGLQAGWQHPSIQFSHVDYPKLIAVMSAQIATIFGYWNEYLPKLSLIFLFIPLAITSISFFYQDKVYLLMLIPILWVGDWLWNGYMDGYLALYFGMGILLGYKFFNSKCFLYLQASSTFLISCLYLKNEGQMAVLVAIIVFTIYLFSTMDSIFTKNNNFYFISGIVFIFQLIPFFLWSIYKLVWGIHNDLKIGSQAFFHRILERISNQSWSTILMEITDQIILPLVIFLILLIVLRNYNGIVISPTFFGVTALLYTLGMIFIYLSTPYDLGYHLRTSIDRTMLPVAVVLWFGSFVLIENLPLSSFPMIQKQHTSS